MSAQFKSESESYFKRMLPTESFKDMRIWQWKKKGRGRKKLDIVEVIQYETGCFVVSLNNKDVSCKYSSLEELEFNEGVYLIRKFKEEVQNDMALKLSEIKPDTKLSANMTWVETDDGTNKGIFAGYNKDGQPQFVWQIQNGNKVAMTDMKASIKQMLESGQTTKDKSNGVTSTSTSTKQEENSNMNFTVPNFNTQVPTTAQPVNTQPQPVNTQLQPTNTNNVAQFTQNPQVKRTKERKRAPTTETVDVDYDGSNGNYVINYRFRADENSPWQDNKFNIPSAAVNQQAVSQYITYAMRDVFTKLVRATDTDDRQAKVNAIADKFRSVNEGNKLVETRGAGTGAKRGGDGTGRVKRTNIYAAAMAATFQGVTIGEANKKWDNMTEQQRNNVMNFPAFAAKLRELQGGGAGAVAQDELAALLG